ncbi:MAG: hypothetical protein R6V59_02510 [Dehalococcoidia bacterium]
MYSAISRQQLTGNSTSRQVIDSSSDTRQASTVVFQFIAAGTVTGTVAATHTVFHGPVSPSSNTTPIACSWRMLLLIGALP